MRRKMILIIILLGLAGGIVYLYIKSNRSQDLAVATKLQKICNSQKKYFMANNGKYGSLTNLVENGVLDKSFSETESNGYHFEVIVGSSSYSVIASPLNSNSNSGFQQFYVDDKNDKVRWRRFFPDFQNSKPEEGIYYNDGKLLLCGN